MASKIKQINRKTITSLVVDVLREKILSHEIAGGTPLRQDALAAQLNVSRIPVREALLQLEAQGLVEFAPHRGAVATRISVEEVDELFGLRAVLECDVLGYALAKTTDDDLDKSRLILDQFDELLQPGADIRRWGTLNWKFHRSLYEPSGRKKTLALISQLHINCDRYLRMEIQLIADYSRAEKEHHELLSLCQARDKRRAKMCLKDHILTTGKELVRALKTIA